MPPGGQSPWFHSSDEWFLVDEAPFALVTRDRTTGQIQICESRGGSAWDFLTLAALEAADWPADGWLAEGRLRCERPDRRMHHGRRIRDPNAKNPRRLSASGV